MNTTDIIERLVERFDEHHSAYVSEKYNETQLRREFLDPFFECLGWDVSNKMGRSEVYKEVIHEDRVKIKEGRDAGRKVLRAPDYAFRIGGTRKFFVEAKKPSVNLERNLDPAFQLRCYAWSAKLPVSILTDFEEFAIYDCRVKPDKGDKPKVALLDYFRYDQYVKEWDRIAGTFSHDAVQNGLLDQKYAAASKRKKGTVEVDDAFLVEIEYWRELLAKNIALNNPKLSARALNYAVQMTIDRIIFLRICEDRGIERDDQLQDIASGRNIYENLCHLFQRADTRYNSGLFHFGKEKNESSVADTLTMGLKIDDQVLNKILKNLYYPDSPYVFGVISADILGHVYERFLGKIIQLSPSHQAIVEEKPEVRKAGGVYYTPTHIVDHIVKNTIGKLLKGKTPNEVARLKILDPACGSGSFALVAYQCLLDWHLDWYTSGDSKRWAAGKNPAIFEAKGGWHLTTAKKKEILLNNIFGVDIDAQAVEMTKLSLLLKVLEGETHETIGSQLVLWHERVLPDLGKNIQCGNSLIGHDYYEGYQLTMSFVDDEERYRVNPFDWRAAFPQVFIQNGFDVIIGNPPYGALLTLKEAEYVSKIFDLQQYQLDSYLLFVEKSLSLVKKQGLIGFIIPNTWLLNLLSSQIRKFIFENSSIEKIIHHKYRVFQDATVDTEIVIFNNSLPDIQHNIKITIEEKDGAHLNYFIPQQKWILSNGLPVNVFERNEFSDLITKIKAFSALDTICKITQGTKPFQVGKGKPSQTQKIVDEKSFVAETKKNKTFRPLLRGSLMYKYKINWDNNYWISFGDWLAEPRYSANYDADEKIVIRQTGDSLVATLDTNQFIVRDNLYTIVSVEKTNLRYVLALLNSKLLNWFYQTVLNPERGEALAQVKRGHLSQLPIRPINFFDPYDKALHDKIVSLVDQILELHKQHPNTPHEQEILSREIKSVDRMIDELVYELYGLTAEEIKIVEES